jgi:excisionase family DNA binding protein
MLIDEKLLEVKEVAAILRQSPAAIYRKVASGELDAVRLGRGTSALRIPESRLEAFLRDQLGQPAVGAADHPQSTPSRRGAEEQA